MLYKLKTGQSIVGRNDTRSSIIKRWSEAESFTIFENHVYPSKKNLMFAINLVNFCSIFGSFFYAIQAKVCHRFGEFLLHFWEFFLMLHM